MFPGIWDTRLKRVDVLSVVAVPAVAYLILVALVAVDSLLPAVPSEVLVVAAGALAAAGDLAAGWAMAAAAVGAFAGDHVVYRIGRHGLSGVLARCWWGRQVTQSVAGVHDRFRAVSGAAIVAARFMPFGRTLGAGAAGLAGVRPSRFSTYSVVGVLLWSAWLTGLGFITGTQTGWPLWISVVTGMAVAMLVGICVAVAHARGHRATRAAAKMRVPIDPLAPAPQAPDSALGGVVVGGSAKGSFGHRDESIRHGRRVETAAGVEQVKRVEAGDDI